MRRLYSREVLSQRVAGLARLGVGLLLLLGSGTYYVYGVKAKADLDKLSYSADRPAAAIDDEQPSPSAASGEAQRQTGALPVGAVARQEGGTTPSGASAAGTSAAPQDARLEGRQDGLATVAKTADGGGVQNTEQSVVDGAKTGDASAVVAVAVSPKETGEQIPLKTAELDPVRQQKAPAGSFVYEPLAELQAEAALYSPPGSFDLLGRPGPPTQIRIPALSVDSGVNQLEVVRLSDSYAWQTPDRIVGHIPTTASPGEQGQGWYFGHLESPIRGEGNVFASLPGITTYLDAGQTVYVFVDDADRQYVYEVYKVEVVHQDDLKVTDSGNQDITLVTCVPRFYYDHRLLVTAALVGVRES